MTLSAERWLDEVILLGSVADVAGASINEQFSLPAGLGDIAVLSVSVYVIQVATVPGAATVARGVRVTVNSPSALGVDVVGVGEWMATSGSLAAFDEFAAFVDPDALCLVRQNELISVRSPEMDVNAAPTGDLTIQVKAVRVRPIEGVVRGPLRLVNVSDM